MTTRRWIVLAAVVAALAGAGGVYVAFFQGSSVERLDLGEGGGEAGGSADLEGRWTVAQGSEVGYRVREKFARLPAKSDAVGRTAAVTGGVTIAEDADGVVVSAMSFEVDMTTLLSDKDRRDDALRTRGLQTDTFTTATFVATAPVEVDASALSGGRLEATVPGNLTLRGVTKPIELPVSARRDGDAIEIAGSILLQMADYGIEPPHVAGILTVDPEGTLEFLIRLEKGSGGETSSPSPAAP